MYKIIPQNERVDYLRKQTTKIASFLEEHKLDYDMFNCSNFKIHDKYFYGNFS